MAVPAEEEEDEDEEEDEAEGRAKVCGEDAGAANDAACDGNTSDVPGPVLGAGPMLGE
jgi:hypothetical protein